MTHNEIRVQSSIYLCQFGTPFTSNESARNLIVAFYFILFNRLQRQKTNFAKAGRNAVNAPKIQILWVKILH